MSELEKKIKSCTNCELHKRVNNIVVGRGAAKPKIFFVGEAPGMEEDKQGQPFVGRSGKLLEKWIEELGLNTGDYYITNVVKCRPPENRDPTNEEINACIPFLFEQIKELNPKVIVPLGRFAARILIGNEAESISKRAGRLFEVNGQEIFPVFHPAYYLRRGALGMNPEIEKLKAFLEKKDIKEKQKNLAEF